MASRFSISSVLVLSSRVRFSREAKKSIRSRLIEVIESNASESARSPVPTRKIRPRALAASRSSSSNESAKFAYTWKDGLSARNSCKKQYEQSIGQFDASVSTRYPQQANSEDPAGHGARNGVLRRAITSRRLPAPNGSGAPGAGRVASRVSLSATCVTGTSRASAPRMRVASAEPAHPCSTNTASRSNFIFSLFHCFSVHFSFLAGEHFNYSCKSRTRAIERLEQMRQFGGASHSKRNRELIRGKLFGQDYRNAARELQRRDFRADLLLHSFQERVAKRS